MDVINAHPNSSAIHPEPRIEFTWEAIENADSYEFYLIEKVHLDFGNPQFGDTLTTSNTSIIVGQPEGEKLPKHGTFTLVVLRDPTIKIKGYYIKLDILNPLHLIL